jgi:hypothetical protein
MGIFPYQSPIEWNRMDRAIKHYNDFCKLRGYEVLFDHGSDGNWMDSNGVHHRISSKPWRGKDGKDYTDKEEFYKNNGWYPYYIKDGVCYGMFQPQKEDGYLDPWDEEVKFLTERGYKRLGDIFSDDYIKNIGLSSDFYDKNKWMPRWEKDGKQYGHPELLVELGYQYTGFPDYPVLCPSDYGKPKGWL